MRISDWSSDVCSSDLPRRIIPGDGRQPMSAQTNDRQSHADPDQLLTVADVAAHIVAHEHTVRHMIQRAEQIARASIRYPVCRYVYTPAVAGSVNYKLSNTPF